MTTTSLKYLPHLAVVFLLAALFHYTDCRSYDILCINYPYGFYILLRFVVCACFVLMAYRFHQHPVKFIISNLFALIYNPIIKIAFPLTVWLVINFISILVIIFFERKSHD